MSSSTFFHFEDDDEDQQQGNFDDSSSSSSFSDHEDDPDSTNGYASASTANASTSNTNVNFNTNAGSATPNQPSSSASSSFLSPPPSSASRPSSYSGDAAIRPISTPSSSPCMSKFVLPHHRQLNQQQQQQSQSPIPSLASSATNGSFSSRTSSSNTTHNNLVIVHSSNNDAITAARRRQAERERAAETNNTSTSHSNNTRNNHVTGGISASLQRLSLRQHHHQQQDDDDHVTIVHQNQNDFRRPRGASFGASSESSFGSNTTGSHAASMYSTPATSPRGSFFSNPSAVMNSTTGSTGTDYGTGTDNSTDYGIGTSTASHTNRNNNINNITVGGRIVGLGAGLAIGTILHPESTASHLNPNHHSFRLTALREEKNKSDKQNPGQRKQRRWDNDKFVGIASEISQCNSTKGPEKGTRGMKIANLYAQAEMEKAKYMLPNYPNNYRTIFGTLATAEYHHDNRSRNRDTYTSSTTTNDNDASGTNDHHRMHQGISELEIDGDIQVDGIGAASKEIQGLTREELLKVRQRFIDGEV